MKVFAVDFSYYEWDQLVFTIDWVKCNDPKNIRAKLEKKYGYVHINDYRELAVFRN
ncbi:MULTISPECIES: hypothetical protein [Enterococcus]|jgi:hypothetical protein|uniref:hypothetical protein n=1 Tax=Enterococcus TaxID=1350 RepID=UPI00159F687B|nr:MULTISPECIES: hypothetical protein [Enterococcus]MDB1729508.1 hypothetical protein [Enterococcus avium]MDB1733584.1 hypothetical protein [Enterococcus avium]